MPLCASFIHSRRHDAAWSRCLHPAQRGDILCLAHREALDGLTMGILEMNLSAYANQKRQTLREGRAPTERRICRIDFLATEPVIHPAKNSRARRNSPRFRLMRETSGSKEAAR